MSRSPSTTCAVDTRHLIQSESEISCSALNAVWRWTISSRGISGPAGKSARGLCLGPTARNGWREVSTGTHNQDHPGNWTGNRPCYLLPIRCEMGQHNAGELADYLRYIARWCDVLIVDGSPEPVFTLHERAWSAIACHIRPILSWSAATER